MAAALIASASPLPLRAAVPAQKLTAAGLFDVAERARAEARFGDAEAIYRAMAHDPDAQIRAESRFRLGMMFAGLRRYRDAAIAFRALLDEQPRANRARLELARVLTLMGDEDGARRQLRQAQAAGLPPEVAVTVGRFVKALRSSRPFGGSLEVSLAPDSNINRATRATTLDTVIAPLTLDDDARAQSGVGLKLGGEVFARVPLADRAALVLRGVGNASLYRQKQFDDISAGISAGPEVRIGGDRWRPAVGLGRRYYGGDLYARTRTASLSGLHPIGHRSQITVELQAAQARYPRNRLQDGPVYDGSLALEHGFSARSGMSLTLFGNRQDARDAGYATWAGGASALLWREVGTTTLYGTATYRHLGSDARLSLYPRSRTDDYVRIGAGASFRKLALAGLAPIVRVGFERNRSTVGLYDYRRLSVDIGIVRAF